MKLYKDKVEKDVPAELVSDYIAAGWNEKKENKIEVKPKKEENQKEKING